jgi:hypothetical protein
MFYFDLNIPFQHCPNRTIFIFCKIYYFFEIINGRVGRFEVNHQDNIFKTGRMLCSPYTLCIDFTSCYILFHFTQKYKHCASYAGR